MLAPIIDNAHLPQDIAESLVLKHRLEGIYQHCGEQHLKRYLSEFDFRYGHRKITDSERMDVALRGIIGKRLTYKPTN